jgi:hypothetical protein
MPTLVTRGAASVRGFGFAGTTPVLADPYFNYTTLLLHGNGTNGGQNNTFLDSGTANSGSGFTITRNGNTTQGTFSPFSQTGWSNYFDGSGDYLQAGTSSNLALGSGDFTVEGWHFCTGYNGGGALYSTINTYPSSTGFLFYIYSDGSYTIDVNGTILKTTAVAALNTWVHYAVVRSGSTITIYANGTSVGTVSNSTNFTDQYAVIGRTGAGTASNYYLGYLSNCRTVKGTAVYTSAFTPPTAPLTAITNTQFLTCQSNRFIDNSANQFTITVNGNTSVQAFSPFAPTAAYSASTVGGSGYFDGTGDNLSIANNAAFQFGSGDFTVEAWVYAPSNPPGIGSIVSHSDGASASGTQFLVRTEGSNTSVVAAVYSGGTAYVATWSSALPIGQWNHVAFTRSGTSTYLWVNGVQRATASVGSVSLNTTSTALTIGSNASASADNWLGYISGTRITKGAALYTATFTPPTAPPTTTVSSGTVGVLLNFTNAGIFDNAQMNDLETVGNVQISTSVVKYGTGSMAFDGSGDYLVGPMTPNLVFGSGNMTFEFWVYANTISGFDTIFDTRTSGGYGNEAFSVFLDGGIPKLFAGSYSGGSPVIAGSSAISTATWTHIAFTRSSGTNYLFVNGTSVTSNTNSWNQTLVTTNIFRIGEQVSDDVRPFDGYIDDLRITKGIARYTSNFTPQTSQWQDQ